MSDIDAIGTSQPSEPAASRESGAPAPRRVAVTTLGCKVNQVEGEELLAGALDAGAERGSEDAADVVVINTCTVTHEADTKARKAIRHALSRNPAATVVVTGCLAAVSPDEVAAISGRVLVESDVSRAAALIKRLVGPPDADRATAPSAATPRVTRTGRGFHTRSMVKVEDGCDAFCAYCIVPFARGVPRSVPIQDVVAECSSLVSAGAREIVLTGINIGRYDDVGSGLAELLSHVAETDVARIRLSSIEPMDVTDDLLSAFASVPALCEHLHVPLQSGDDDVLRQMGRGYTSGEYAERIDAARNAIPGLVLTTDVMAGFPGETAEQAARTLAFCRELGFARLHVFRYSERPGTPAAGRTDQVPPAARAARARALRALDADLRSAHRLAACGSERDVLVERIRDDGPVRRAEGTTRDYLRVSLECPQSLADVGPGDLVRVRIGEPVTNGVMTGVMTEGTNTRQG